MEDALRLGADEVVVSKNSDEIKKHASSFDFILDTVAEHDINQYLNLLTMDGDLTLVGAPTKPLALYCHLPSFSATIASQARTLAAFRRHTRCSIFVANTTSRPTWKLSQSKRLTKSL